MPIIKKVMRMGRGGASRAVVLPKEWVEYLERRLGRPVEYVAIEIDDELRISPYFPEEAKKALGVG
jgi:bifunctional DNA-binding transcriptional regulator/antitoxin component of YhaV-PrlF toxin-antitoxin module